MDIHKWSGKCRVHFLARNLLEFS